MRTPLMLELYHNNLSVNTQGVCVVFAGRRLTTTPVVMV